MKALKFLNEHKNTTIISVCVVVILGLLIFFGTASGRSTAAENAFKTATTPVQRFFGNIGNNIYDITHSLSSLKELRNNVDELTKQNTEYEKQISEQSELEEENDRLKRMLELRDDNKDLDLAAASVAANEPSNWFSGFTIDKGESSGITTDQAVLSSDGFLIGKVVKTGANWAEVMTIIDPAFSAGVMVERSRDLGVAEGDADLRYNMQFKLSYLTRETDIEEGDYVTTTGLGGIFPAGFRLGKVETVMTDTATMSMYAVVNTCVDLSDLRQIFVVRNNMDIVAEEENANMKSAREDAERKQQEINEQQEKDEESQDEENEDDESENEDIDNSDDTDDTDDDDNSEYSEENTDDDDTDSEE